MMLSRTAARSSLGARAVALTTPATLSQRSLPVIWSRGMAKDNKSQHQRFSRPQNAPAQKPSSPLEQQQKPQQQQEQQQSTSTSKPSPPPTAAPKQPEPQDQKTTPTPEPEEQDPIPDLSKLPDLTQGIPSTLEYETAGASSRSQMTAVEEEEAAGSGGGGSGGRPRQGSDYVSSTDRRRRAMAKWFFGLGTMAIVGGTVYLGRDWEDDEVDKHADVPNGWGPLHWFNRARARMGDTVTYFQEPAFEKLLPDPDPSFERPYTLCISLEDMLVHSEWTREHGWRLAKRPGVDYFLHYLSQYYEIVLFTSVPFGIAEPLVRKLDPYRFIIWPLFREATKYRDGEIVKDLSYLNRDLSKVIIIDTDAKHVRAQPENAIVLPKWTGDAKDAELVNLVPFLEFIHTMQYSDVRKVLKSFEGQHIPTEFARREAIARAEHNKMVAAKKRSGGGGGGIGWLGSQLGLKPSNMSLLVAPPGEENAQEAFSKGKMLQDIARERGMRNYLMLEEEIRKNGQKWLKEEEEMQAKLTKEAMKNMQGSFFGWFGGSKEDAKEEPKQ
ncbi:hypothetical protein B0T17DRAFT_491584 [Bombardia bombarda]|uniref:Mitochondrial import inner membrane translocase subunit TIM50 n=1 Tax=Bombardia bombarda TaxID=252184 RepID=A0AA39X040_9PEZI|nr:hypothetical protein B0T17DRAFT_491584 [Bombardia bombarda]